MRYTDVHKVRSHLATLEAMVERRFSDRADDEALLEFRRVCWAALLLVRDADFQEQIDLLVQHAKELFRGGDAASDARINLRVVLAACSARLYLAERGYGKRWRDLRAA
jgi:hypothetical protein